MAATSSSSPNVFQSLNLSGPHWLALLLLFWALPFPYIVNSIAMGAFVLTTILQARKTGTFSPNLALALPVAIYALMAVSLIWTIRPDLTIPALSKELSFIVVPLCFMALPPLRDEDRKNILYGFAWGFVFYSVFCLIKAILRYAASGDSNVFFYHELVSLDVNAIHVSVFLAVAFFALLTKERKRWYDYAGMAVLFLTISLLSSKNVTLVFVCLLGAYPWLHGNFSLRAKIGIITTVFAIMAFMAFNGRVRDRLQTEYQTLFTDNTTNTAIGSPGSPVYNVSVRQAWSDQAFHPNQYFSGAAFRVYQARIFLEMMKRDNAWLLGYGLNASYPKISQKGREYNLYKGKDGQYGYGQLNFHNQYLQIFAELGIIGFLLILAMLLISVKKAVKHKDFLHISFTVLAITVFLTESFLWRQRGATFFIAMYCMMMYSRQTDKKTL